MAGLPLNRSEGRSIGRLTRCNHGFPDTREGDCNAGGDRKYDPITDSTRGRDAATGTSSTRITKPHPVQETDAMSRKVLSAVVLLGLAAAIVRVADVYTRPLTDGLD